MTVPLYSKDRKALWGVGFRQLMGVVVVYFRGPQNHTAALVAYGSAVAATATPMSDLMVHRSLFVEGRANRVKRNWRVMRIALRFVFPMFVRYVQQVACSRFLLFYCCSPRPQTFSERLDWKLKQLERESQAICRLHSSEPLQYIAWAGPIGNAKKKGQQSRSRLKKRFPT